MKLRIPAICLTHVLLLSCARMPAPVQAADGTVTETQKIEKLIAYVGDLKGVEFIRKGTAYDAADAAKFMRGKWNWKSDEIKTARDFVRVCSAGGSGEGEPYFIQWQDGTKVPSKEVLTRELDLLETHP